MRVLYLITGLRLGGAETQLMLLAENMQKQGLDVLVVAMESGGIVAEKMRKKGISVTELDITGAVSIIKGYRKFKSIVIQFSPDVIHSHMIHANLFARTFKLFNKVPKLISTAHNTVEGSDVLMAGYRVTSSIADWSTNVSKEAYDYFISKKYFNPLKSSYIPNAIDTIRFSPEAESGRLLRKQLGISDTACVFFNAGRLHEQKNQAMLLKAFKTVSTQINDCVLVIAGDGPLKNDLALLAKDLNIDKRVLFLGPREDMPDLMNLCNCFVLSSAYEGFGLVVGEAMATTKPVIATDCGGVKEVMGGYGQLVEVNDIQNMAKAMLKAYQTPVEDLKLAETRAYIQHNYATELVVKQWLNIYGN